MSNSFQQWLPLDRLGVGRLSQFGDLPAVYAFRDSITGDILKYGSTDRLQRRIIGNFIGGVGGSTTQFIHGQLFARNWIDHLELAWLEVNDAAEAKPKEKQFRAEYKKAKGWWPLWDRQD